MSFWTQFPTLRNANDSAPPVPAKVQRVAPMLRNPQPNLQPREWEQQSPLSPTLYDNASLSPQWSIGDDSQRYVFPTPSISPTWSCSSSIDAPPNNFSPGFTDIRTGIELDPEYAAFRNSKYEIMRIKNGGTYCISNPRMRRSVCLYNTAPDADYLKRREQNNVAAKRSRDLRKMKEDDIAIQVAFLESQHEKLVKELNDINMQLGLTRR